jgi:predicted signal transduction protein with EAL and GGDEF domain
VVLAGALTTLVAAGAACSGRSDRAARASHEAHLRALSLQDPRTGLANRAGLLDELTRTGPDGRELVVVELERFAAVAAALGDAVTDDLLHAAGMRLSDIVDGRTPIVGRIGGGRFAFVVHRPHGQTVAGSAVAALGAEPLLPGSDLLLGAAAGVADVDTDVAQSLRHAEIAAARAVTRTGDRVVVFAPELWTDAVERRDLLTGLRLAVQRQELMVCYQPIVDLTDGSVVAAEALVRWNHPTRGVLLPVDFLPFAERSGLVNAIDAAVIEQALNDLATWGPVLAGRPFRLHLNVSPSGLVGHDLPGVLSRRCLALGLTPPLLCIELTETTLPDDLDAAVAVLRELRALGVTVAYDDFGTGYANVAMLRRLPLDEVKVDRSLITGLPGEEDQRGVLRLLAGLAGGLGLSLTAEGVETVEERDALVALGYRHGQGYLWGAPMHPDDFLIRLGAPDDD